MVGTPVADEYRKLSFWHETVPGTLEPGDPLAGDLDADVAIADAGRPGPDARRGPLGSSGGCSAPDDRAVSAFCRHGFRAPRALAQGPAGLTSMATPARRTYHHQREVARRG
jgi:hypothetical protein